MAPKLLALLGLAVALSGCADRRYAQFQAQVEDQTAAYLQCPIDQVHADQVGEATWQVQACGRVVMFRCHRMPWVGMRCRRPRTEAVVAVAPPQEQAAVAAPPPATSAPPPTVYPNALAALTALRDSLRACTNGPATVVVRWTVDGQLRGGVEGGEGTPADACVQALFAGVRVQSAEGAGGTLVQELP